MLQVQDKLEEFVYEVVNGIVKDPNHEAVHQTAEQLLEMDVELPIEGIEGQSIDQLDADNVQKLVRDIYLDGEKEKEQSLPNVITSTDEGPVFDSKFYDDMRRQYKTLGEWGRTEPIQVIGGAYPYEDVMEFIGYLSEQPQEQYFPTYPVDAAGAVEVDEGELFQVWAVLAMELPPERAENRIEEPPTNCIKHWWRTNRGFGGDWSFDPS